MNVAFVPALSVTRALVEDRARARSQHNAEGCCWLDELIVEGKDTWCRYRSGAQDADCGYIQKKEATVPEKNCVMLKKTQASKGLWSKKVV